MRRRHRAGVLRRLALGPAALGFFRDPAAAARSSRPATLRSGGPVTAAATGEDVGPTQTPVRASGAPSRAPLAAWAARPARRLSTPAVA